MGVNENLSAGVIQREKNSICINPDKNEHQKGVPKISKSSITSSRANPSKLIRVRLKKE